MADYKQIRVRRDTITNWVGVVPAAGEPTLETDSGRFRVADGTKENADLDYAAMVDPDTDEFSDEIKGALARTFC
jgi:hypothetical protein